MPTVPTPTTPRVPSYVYYIVAVLVVAVVMLLFQIIYIRVHLSKYSKDDYYKQLIVKNEFQSNGQSCSNLGVYAVTVVTNLVQIINQGVLLGLASSSIQLPAFVYSIPTSSGFQSIEYTNRDIVLLPLTKSPGSSRLVNDILGQRVDYITWASNVFRASVSMDYKDRMQEFMLSNGYDELFESLDGITIIVLTKIPSLATLKDADYTFGESIDNNTPATIIYSIIGSSQNTLDLVALSERPVIHMIGYKI